MKNFLLIGMLILVGINVSQAETETKVLFSCLKKDATADGKRIEIRVVNDYYVNLVYEGDEDNQKIFNKPLRWNMSVDDITKNNSDKFEAKYKHGFWLDFNYQTNEIKINFETGNGKAGFYYRSLSGCGGFEKDEEQIELIDCRAM